jgi:hypothetical protein
MKEEVKDFPGAWKYRFTAAIMGLAEVKMG